MRDQCWLCLEPVSLCCCPQTLSDPADAVPRLRDALAEVERLTGCLTQANAQAERFERQWYLRGDELDRLRALIKRARPYVQAYAAITRTDEVSLDASETAEAMRLSGPTSAGPGV